ncbi:aldehyde dehydrogenase family protein [Pseudomonas sp. JS3066]|uniref:aldehyde dehydrogenase family protein n=1 Tax=unclassified Pseudomonas TaxID=196821 RepID=UPI000EA92B6A|nr:MULTISPECIES: aldehyde dehydrogenase family protein [unclassified Pseudomonas]AYF90613.1 aldehyde dehydrogenase family protein [Pseudomonas sp. DY-1]MDH4653368.1 aldehyde dehydrogenase family protein [Pseudomonas sp. BN606]MRK21161.1 aldehyde dehydrogenase family protein [Pseudomonas sp. JG-B]WVK91800.1 aldehyde dehydrogenase family protein [Pseudomonas sp. JS3066]
MDIKVKDYLQQFGVSEATQRFLGKTQKMFVGGAWLEPADGASAEVIEPSTGAVLTRIPMGAPEDLDRAVQAARAQFDGGAWSQLKPLERERLLHGLADLIEANADELAEIESIDMGKSVAQARAVDIQGTIDTFRYFAGWASKIHGRTVEPSLPGNYLAYTRKEPVGVVGVIVPWNFPLQTMAWKLGAALAVGCTVVVKPAELTSLSALRFAELVQEAGIPDGVVNIVTGRGSVVGAAMSCHPGIDKLSFTGSTPVGCGVGKAAMDQMKRLTLELGGKSPVIVFADADIKAAAQAVANGVFFNSGQVCDAGTRAYVHRSVYAEFLRELASYTATLKIAPGLDPDCFISPMVSRQQQQRVLEYIEAGKAEGAELYYGGEPVEGPGYFVQPTVFANCRNDMRIVQEEIFGPVLVTAAFDTEEEALALANDSLFGLAAALYSNDLGRVHNLIPRLRAGTVYVNAHSTLDPSMPFGGYKQSGYGKDLGSEQLEYLLETKAVWITLP